VRIAIPNARRVACDMSSDEARCVALARPFLRLP
jgi:hypothetical protein